MDKTAIKNFAIQARKDLIAGVKQKAYEYGIDEKTIGNEAPTGAILNGRILTSEEQSQRNELLNLIKTKGFNQVMEEVAYTWFNRFIALRFMEANEYLPSRIRIFTNEKNEFQPEILSEALHLDLEGLDKAKVILLLEANQTEELYKYLLIIQCNDLNSILPEMFEKIQNYTELLFPNNLLKDGNVLSLMISSISLEDWTDAVEIIGWLYQYYNTEVKDETFALLSKNVKITKERIPAATQLFTPDWIVRYMVENSLGRLWIEGHPSDSLKSNWKYYLDEAEQNSEVVEQLKNIRAEYAKIKPEEIKVIDPCMGSGHVLVYAFDVLMQIYVAIGYSERDSAKSILQNNLFGLDIDDRAYQLAYFAVMMKARKYCRTIFVANIRPNLYSIRESDFMTPELIDYMANGDSGIKYDLLTIMETLNEAKECGSILNMPIVNFERIFNRLESIQIDHETDLQLVFFQETVTRLMIPLMHQVQVMSQKYDVTVTNPPYLGSNGMSAKLSEYVKNNYPDSKSDLFAVFIERCRAMTKRSGYQAMITQHSWMFLSSFEKLRRKMLIDDTVNMAHLGARAFDEIGGEVVQTTTWVTRQNNIKGYYATYARLVDYNNQQAKEKAFLLKQNLHTSQQDNFFLIPGIPVAYWVNENVFRAFTGSKKVGNTRKGMVTADNTRFIRYWYEVDYEKIKFNISDRNRALSSKGKWFPYQKGGAYRRWYGNNLWVINWENDGKELLNMQNEGYKVGSTNHNLDYIFKPTICWNKITSSSFSARIVSMGFLFDDASPFYHVKESLQNYVLGFLLSKPCDVFVGIINPTINFQPGNVANLPIIIDDNHKEKIDELVQCCIRISKNDWDNFETSWDFYKHPLFNNYDVLLKQSYNYLKIIFEDQFNQLKTNEEELNRLFIDIYGLQDELNPKVPNGNVTIRNSDLGRDIRSFVSYIVGCIFGRYSPTYKGLVYAGGNWDDSKYLAIIPDKDNILPISDDVYFEDDIVSKVVNFIKIVYGEETLEENLQFVADAIGNRGNSSREVIRNYFLNDFYKDHLQIYQKRPIYWLFDSGKKNGFKALIYMHRYKPDLLATMRTDYVHEQQERYRTQIQHLEASMRHASPADQAKINKQIVKFKEQSLELLTYEEKIHHLADQMINFDLDDGVKVNYAKFENVLAPIK